MFGLHTMLHDRTKEYSQAPASPGTVKGEIGKLFFIVTSPNETWTNILQFFSLFLKSIGTISSNKGGAERASQFESSSCTSVDS